MALALVQDGLERRAGEDGHAAASRICVFQLARKRVVLQAARTASPTSCSQPCHSAAHVAHHGQRLRHAVFQQFGRGNVAARRRAGPAAGCHGRRNASSSSHSASLLRRLSSMLMRSMPSVYSAMRGSGITTSSLILKALVWLADGRGALAVEPELLARLGADGDEAFAAARVGNAHHLAGGARHGVGVVAGDVAEQHHLGQAAALALGGVAHRLQVAVVQVLQAGQQRAGALLLGKHEVLDLDDAGHRVLGVAEELQAHGARVRRHAVHHPARAGDQAVAAFLLDAGQAAQELVGHVLAQAFLAEGLAGNVQPLGAHQRLAAGLESTAARSWPPPHHGSCPGCGSGASPPATRPAASPCASWPGCPAPCPTARPSCRRRSWRCCRRCRRPRPRSGPRQTQSRRARPHRPRAGSPRRPRSRRWPPAGPGRAACTISTSVMASSFSVLMTALFQVSGIAPPV